MPTKVILDVDTGSDDAVALMCAILSPAIDLIGVCSVNGNRNVDLTTENTLRVIEYLKSNTPVYKGCSLPMVSTLIPGRRKNMPYRGPKNADEDVHGDYLPIPRATKKHQEIHAVNWLVETLKSTTEKITLVCVGPLTNLAMALRLDSSIIDGVERVIIMGGGNLICNITSGAEFNFWVDPEAAKIVMDCGAKILMVPLDATHAAYVSRSDCLALEKLGTPAATACSNFIMSRIKGYNVFQPMPVPETVPVHDALAVCALINPDVLTELTDVYVDVNTAVGPADGMSMLDFENRSKKTPNATIALSADREIFIKTLTQVLGTQE